jgi:uncharacterized protein DUF1016
MIPGDYATLLGEVKARIWSALYAALKAVNRELIGLYWDIGRMIVARQQGGTWGKSVVEQLASDLQAEFPSIQGLSAANLWRMCGFFEAYAHSEKLAPLVREIGWTHNLVIMESARTSWSAARRRSSEPPFSHRGMCREESRRSNAPGQPLSPGSSSRRRIAGSVSAARCSRSDRCRRFRRVARS